MFKYIKYRKIVNIVIICISIFLFCYLFYTKFNRKEYLEIYFLDVGHGDSILIKYNDFNLVVDGGPSAEINYYLSKFFYPLCKIESVLLTHPHADHLDGLELILNRCRVDVVFQTNLNIEKANYNRWINKLSGGNNPLKAVNLVENSRITVSKLKIIVIWPPEEAIEASKLDLNNLALGLFLDYGDFEVLLMSDIEKDAQNEIDTSLFLPLVQGKIDVMKFPHQGSKDALNEEFFEKIDPKYVILSVGKNSYGHPSKETMDFLKTTGTIIYRTDEQGTIKFKYVK